MSMKPSGDVIFQPLAASGKCSVSQDRTNSMSEHTSVGVELGDSVIFQALHDEVVILNLNVHEYYGLDPVGADIWKLLLKHGNVADTVKALQTLYAVDEETAIKDVGKLVSELLASGLLKKAASVA